MAVAIPVNNAVPFAASGLKNTIPVDPSGVPGAASMTAGFPEATMKPLNDGGVPPAGRDFNGILNQLSTHQVYLNAGGVYKFDEAHADDIGGYRKGAVLLLDNELSSVQSTVDNNTTDPNSDMTGWQLYGGKLVNEKIAELEGGLVGSIAIWPTSTVPDGYLECAGQEISRTTYAALFTKLGTTYGPGDGTTTFILPDLRGQFLRGWDHGRGIDSGRTIGSDQNDAQQDLAGEIMTLQNSTHAPSGIFNADSSTPAVVSGGSSDFTHDVVSLDLAAAGIRVADEVRPKNIAMMFIIKT